MAKKTITSKLIEKLNKGETLTLSKIRKAGSANPYSHMAYLKKLGYFFEVKDSYNRTKAIKYVA